MRYHAPSRPMMRYAPISTSIDGVMRAWTSLIEHPAMDGAPRKALVRPMLEPGSEEGLGQLGEQVHRGEIVVDGYRQIRRAADGKEVCVVVRGPIIAASRRQWRAVV